MCGIVAAFNVSVDLVRAALQRLSHRGPNARGIAQLDNGKCTLGHARLAILDLHPRSNQPFSSNCGNYHLVFNGEIYNYEELRRELMQLGCQFSTQSDTEVLLHWLIRYGRAGIGKLRGPFSFVFVNTQTHSAIAARDLLGEKPLFYHHSQYSDPPTLSFTSELPAALVFKEGSVAFDSDAIEDYLRFLYIPAPRTMVKGVLELEPGHLLEVQYGKTIEFVSHRYMSVEELVRNQIPAMSKMTSSDAAEWFHAYFQSKVHQQLVSDVGVGLFLSGGLDSAAICSAITQSGKRAVTGYCLNYGTSSEAPGARATASLCGINLEVVAWPEPSFQESIGEACRVVGQPFGNYTVLATSHLSRIVSSYSRVCLTGDGGDELLAGYPRYHAVGLLDKISLLPMWFRHLLGNGLRSFTHIFDTSSLHRASEFLLTEGNSRATAFLEWSTYCTPNDVARLIKHSSGVSGFGQKLIAAFTEFEDSPLRACSIVDMLGFVPYNLLRCADRGGMRHGVELRVPFLDVDLVAATLAMNDNVRHVRGQTKPLLTRGTRLHFAEGVLGARKLPFNPPIRDAIGRNRDAVMRCLGREIGPLADFVRMDGIAQLLRRRFDLGERCDTLLWGLLVLDEWMKTTLT